MDMLSPSQHFADLILGDFDSSIAIKGLQVANSTAAQYTIYDVMPRAITSNTTMKIYGLFDSHDAFDIIIVPKRALYQIPSQFYPNCSFLTSNATTITCQYHAPSTYTSKARIAIWMVMVRSKNTNYVISWNISNSNSSSSSSNSASFYALDYITPNVTFAQSNCVRDTVKCINNS